MRRRILVAMLLIGPFVALGLSVAFLKTDFGERRVLGLVQTIVNDEIPGKMTVERLDDIEMFSPIGIVRASAVGVRFLDPEGTEVIRVERATVEFDAMALIDKEVRFRRANVDGGVVTIQTMNRGGLGIERTFGSPDTERSSPLFIDLHDMHVQNMRLVAHLSPTQTLEFDELAGTVDVIVDPDDPGATLHLRHFAGAMEKPQPVGVRIILLDADGAIRGGQDRVVELAYRAKFGAGELEGEFTLSPGHDRPARLSVRPTGTLAKLATSFANIQSTFGRGLQIEVLDAASPSVQETDQVR